MSTWWLLWIVGMFLFVMPALGYGWGYRGWGPAYPRYIQRRRAEQAALMNASGPFDHHAWGVGSDFVWTVSWWAAYSWPLPLLRQVLIDRSQIVMVG
jgi:hypothetical protein